MSRTSTGSFCVLLLCCLSVAGCASNYEVRYQRGATRPAESVMQAPSQGPAHGKLGIPPGHLPKPGQCRIWIPGVPPGKQSPPGDCAELSSRVPRGAWLISRTKHDKKHVRVTEYHQAKSGSRLEVRVYNASSGVFVRWDKR